NLGSYFLLVVLLMAIALPCLSAHPRAFVSSASNVSEFGQPYQSAYLLAHGIGEPVADATTEVEIPEAGEYRVWARTKDWVPDAHPGTFQILVDGKPIDKVFGASGKGWSWELAEHVMLPQGRASISLHDLTGFEGRCDALYITNTTIVPIDEPALAGRRWRKRLLGIPEEPVDAGEYDVVVVGGGIAGCCAAYAAARSGCRTALLHEMEYLGGNASSEVGLTPEGRTGGIVDKLSERLEDGDIAAARILGDMPNCDVLLSERVFDVHCDGRQITSVDAANVKTGSESRFRGKQFIDCSGRAILGVLSGAATMEGQESRSDFGEGLAPKRADSMHHGDTVLFRTEMADAPVDFPDVPWATKVAKDYSDLGGQIGRVTSLRGQGPYENQPGPYVGPKKLRPLRRADGGWDNAMSLDKSHFWEYGQWLDPYMSKEEIRDHLFCAIIGTYANVRKKDPARYKNLKLVYLGNVLATGAFRSYLGDYVLTENDIRNHTDFPDAIVENAGAFCLHYPGNKKYDFRLGNWRWVERDFKPYTVPLRCLYSADIDNLLCAGKHISATHIASSTIKLMGNCGHQGVVTGAAAALCARYGVSPRELGQERLADLKAVLGKLGEGPAQ
ncbi:MAG: FAD-dependent oxidoreductase, partial [Tractidigestivibacter sp.]|uniref:FAD-dependent oxidoreductase n=1 Tax=Tractidigestivibacter sp. TaxID=2847320 RepID=UPI003D8E4908